MLKKIFTVMIVLSMVLALASCSQPAPETEAKTEAKTEAPTEKATEAATEKATEAATEAPTEAETTAEAAPEAPGESGFVEIEIGEAQLVGPYEVAAVYFQPVDMYPEGKNPSKEESDMHLEADIHLLPEFSAAYGFGGGEGIWPAYLTVKYEVLDKDGNMVTEGSFMPMNADDGPHYGTNVKKGLMTVGQYKLKLTIEPPTDYLLHVDEETGVPAKEGAKDYFTTQECEYDWDYTGEQLQNE